MAGGVALCVLVPGYVLLFALHMDRPRTGTTLSVWLQLGVSAYAGARLCALLVSGTLRPFGFFFWTYVYVWLGIAATAQIATGQSPVPVRGDNGYLALSQLVIVVGVAAYEAGGRLLAGRGGDSRGTVRPVRGYLLAAAVFLLAAPLLIERIGGVDVLFTSREAAGRLLRDRGLIGEDSKVTGTLLVSTVTVTAFALVYALLWKASLVRRLSVAEWAVAVVLLVVNCVVNNPISSARYWVGTVMMAPLLLARPLHRPRAARITMVATLFALLFVFPFTDRYRYTAVVRSQDPVTEQLTTKGDYDSFPQIRAAAEYVGENGHTFGRQLQGVLLFWVPRQAWPDKPMDTGIVLADFEDNDANPNLSAPLWAESYLDFGFPGVVAAFLAWGALSRRLDDLFLRDFRARRPSRATLVVPVLAVYQMILLRGSLLQAMSRLCVAALLLTVLFRRTDGEHDGEEVRDDA